MRTLEVCREDTLASIAIPKLLKHFFQVYIRRPKQSYELSTSITQSKRFARDRARTGSRAP